MRCKTSTKRDKRPIVKQKVTRDYKDRFTKTII